MSLAPLTPCCLDLDLGRVFLNLNNNNLNNNNNNNSSDDNTQLANTSATPVVERHRQDMTTKVISGIPRPDGHSNRVRGDHQILPNGDRFILWSENSYIEQHNPKREMINEVMFVSLRLSTLRHTSSTSLGIQTGLR